ncbi:MAG: DUF1553 domain-containing protein [Pedosphaera sp.]|nr:DUF1553 domain-containing protein [Pedosphaera sp.]
MNHESTAIPLRRPPILRAGSLETSWFGRCRLWKRAPALTFCFDANYRTLLSRTFFYLLACRLGIGSTGAIGAAPATSTDTPLSQHDVIPILLLHCSPCHGGPRQEAKLDVRTPTSLLRGGQSGPALIPGQPDASRMIQRIRDGACPPNTRLVEASVKPVDASSLSRLTAWITAGALELPDEPDQAGTAEDPLVHETDRAFWSFRPPSQNPPPSLRNPTLAANPIDAFILHQLEEKGLSFSPEASSQTLLRRASFDLTGLPPSPADIAAFNSDSGPDAYGRWVDRLLTSPRYGERWGRIWLDVAGYSDAEGKREQHLPRTFAYRYRDYVIQAFNSDKPYDRFLQEQIAGDELADYENVPTLTHELYDNLVATGFLRMPPDPTWANITGFVPDRWDVIADAMEVFGSGVMGLTMRCAQCHNHKFDPLPQRDYYRLVDVFKGALDEYHWLKPDLRPYGGAANLGPLGDRTLALALPEERQAWEKKNKAIQQASDAVKAEEMRLTERYRSQQLASLPEELRNRILETLTLQPPLRTPEQVSLLKQQAKQVSPDRGELKKFDAGFKTQCDALAQLESSKGPEPRIAALWDRGDPSPTYIYRRGDYQRPGPVVRAGVPAVLSKAGVQLNITPPWPGAKKTGRRLALARWLTQPGHPLTSRVMVNRVWRNHMGQGIVKTVGNFGHTGAFPSHPELLDWLAVEFEQQGWSVKRLHRLILTSRTYRQSSIVDSHTLVLDPDNTYLSRMPMHRLEGEALWDSCVAVAGCLDEHRFGPPIPVQTRSDGLVTPGRSGAVWRRSIYGDQLRKEIPTILEVFDLPPMNPHCLVRNESTVAPQALHMLNDSVVRELSLEFARRVQREAGDTSQRQIEGAFLLAFSRPPTRTETAMAMKTMRELTNPLGDGNTPEAALTALCHALINSAEFLYVD